MGTSRTLDQGELEVDNDAVPLISDNGIRLELPWPPSANHYRGQRVIFASIEVMMSAYKSGGWKAVARALRQNSFVQWYLTKEAKAFHEHVKSIVMRDRAAKKWSCPLKLSAWTYPPDRRRRDTSNLFKMLEDALQDAGVFEDDYQIVEHHVCRTTQIVKGGMVVVALEPVVS